MENPDSGYRLAASGAIRQTAISFVDVAWYFAGFALEQYPDLLEQRYVYTHNDADPMPFFEHVGRKRGCLKSGGVVDHERVARILLGDFRDGSLGSMTLETPDMMTKELVLVDKAREEKQARKTERKNNWKNRKR